ncbi:sigma-70 family RNA polymerase sigma factor [Haloplasma contractile]|uniref:RNA polymerase sigma-H factor protein n=1 Tax=Haloplasma contractile SSD-17B TaxID=1033810 RepID=U2FMM4_9MOLU|nr:sigma-70 family RNA polymerase sigma factor [Haloplasma contractile]ERJ12404.1 RNA polymerase sigma-H factor protein [Haloplasma contractile SSD-17B]
MQIDEKEALKLVLKIQSGDHSAYKELHKMYEPIIHIKVRKLRIPLNLKDDFVQEARIALLKAAKTYVKHRKVKFFTFLNVCIDNHLLTCIRNFNRKKHKIINHSISLEEPGRDFIKVNQQLSKNHTVEEMIIAENHFDYCCKKTYKHLEGLERLVFKWMLKGLTANEIATQINRETKAVYAAISRVKKKLYTHLDN